MSSNTVFSQLLQLISRSRFKRCVDQYEGDKYTKRLSCWQQLIVLLFAQAKGLSSLRDIEVSMRSLVKNPLGLTPHYHPGGFFTRLVKVAKDDSYGFPELSPDSILLIDRAFIDYKWLYSFAMQKLFFVTRAKSNMRYEIVGQQPVPQNKGIVQDTRIRLAGKKQ